MIKIKFITGLSDLLDGKANVNEVANIELSNVDNSVVRTNLNVYSIPEVDAILGNKGIISVPDILSNAGGVIASYFEWLQSKEKKRWQKKEVLNKLSKILEKAFDEVWTLSKKENINLRKAAYLLVIDRVVKAMKK